MPDDLKDRLRLSIFPAPRIDDTGALDALEAQLNGYDLCVIDTLSSMTSTTDETTPDAGRLLVRIGHVSHRTRTAIIVVHHSRRDGAIRGGTAIPGAAESTWHVARRGRDVVMQHRRSPTGAPLPEHVLRIRDVEIGGDPLGGLAVDVVGASEPTAAWTLETEIVDYLMKHGPLAGGARSLAARLRRRATDVSDVVTPMVGVGSLRRSGKGPSTRLELP